MKRLGMTAICSLLTLGVGCVTTNTANPYYGQEFRQGLPAFGAAMAPLASPKAAINRDRAGTMQQLQGWGTLMDLMNAGK